MTKFFETFKAARRNAPSFAAQGYKTQPYKGADYSGPDDGIGFAAYAKRKATALCYADVTARDAAESARDELSEAYRAHGSGTPEHKAALAKLNAAESAARLASRATYGHATGGNGAADWLRYVGRVMPDGGGRRGAWDHGGDCGWYTDPHGGVFNDGSGLCYGVVYQLTGKDGKARFVAGFQFGGVDGGPSLDLATIYESGEEGADYDSAEDSGVVIAADDMAKKAAEEEKEYQTAWRAGSDYAEAAEDVGTLRREALAILKERREAATTGPAFPALCDAIRGRVESLREEMAEAREKMSELAAGDYGELIFWPGEERLQSAFCEGAGLDKMPGASA